MPSKTPLTDSLMRRADSMAPNSVAVSAPFARGLESELNAALKDAERYRWLCAQREWHEMTRTQDAMWTCDMPAAEVDAAIDAAMASETQNVRAEPETTA